MTVYIGIGSNIDPEANIPAAVRRLGGVTTITGLSTFYLTEPIGNSTTPAFINGVIRIETDIPPRELKFDVLRSIENALGRIRTEDKYIPRSIDLDIIVYGDLVVSESDLVIPDPDIYTREFVAVPLAELDNGLILPDTGKCISDIARSMQGTSMRPLESFTLALRKEILHEPGANSSPNQGTAC